MPKTDDLYSPWNNYGFLKTCELIHRLTGGEEMTLPLLERELQTEWGENTDDLATFLLDGPLLRHSGSSPLRLAGEGDALPGATSAELVWLRSALCDRRAALFFTDELRRRLLGILDGAQAPAYDARAEALHLFPGAQRAPDYDPGAFRTLLRAIHERRMVFCMNKPYSGAPIACMRAAPYRLEYSFWDGCLRLSFYSLDEGRPVLARLDRLSYVTLLDETFDREDIRGKIEDRRVAAPLKLRVLGPRAVEQALLLLSGYEKENLEIGSDWLTMEIPHYTFQQTELIEIVLSLGPDAEALGPPAFRHALRAVLEERAPSFTGAGG